MGRTTGRGCTTPCIAGRPVRWSRPVVMKIKRHGNTAGPRLDRDEKLRRLRQVGRSAWKQESGYHERSLAETARFRMKTIFGDGVSSRTPARQATEAGVRCRALNIMTHQGMPQGERFVA